MYKYIFICLYVEIRYFKFTYLLRLNNCSIKFLIYVQIIYFKWSCQFEKRLFLIYYFYLYVAFSTQYKNK